MGQSPQEKLQNSQGAKSKVVMLRVAGLSHRCEAGRVKVTQRLEGKSLLKFLRVSHSTFNIVISVNAIHGELFGGK